MLNVADIVLSVVFSIGLTCAAIWFLLKKAFIPLLLGVVEEKYSNADAAISRGMAAMGEKSGEVRQMKSMEKAVFGDLLEQYPEIKAGLEMLSPDTAAMIEENPEMAARLIARWGPIIQTIIPRITGKTGENTRLKQTYDF